jgi:hypothetical protein
LNERHAVLPISCPLYSAPVMIFPPSNDMSVINDRISSLLSECHRFMSSSNTNIPAPIALTLKQQSPHRSHIFCFFMDIHPPSIRYVSCSQTLHTNMQDLVRLLIPKKLHTSFDVFSTNVTQHRVFHLQPL